MCKLFFTSFIPLLYNEGKLTFTSSSSKPDCLSLNIGTHNVPVTGYGTQFDSVLTISYLGAE